MEQGPSLSDYLNLSTRTSTFVSIDIVGSTQLKTGENEQDIIATFLAYHKFVSDQAYLHHGEVIHITGDGILCRFQRAPDAAMMSQALLSGLPAFNKKSNRLSRPLSWRIGIHTGEVREMEGQSGGRLISHTIDIAAKLQQLAPPDRIRISEATYSALQEAARPFARVGWEASLQMNVYEYQMDAPKSIRPGMPESARILIVDDELEEIVKLKKTLRVRHHEAFTVYDQHQTQLCLKSWKPHAILISADLPWEVGWDILRLLRADVRLSRIPIVMLSHQTTGDVVQKAFKQGANGFLRKPLEEQQILKRVEMVLRESYL
jgi:class 3 adenylate cyclase/CheY-like chemotaxis protein